MKTFETACLTPSDINQHLPILKSYSQTCNTVTEIGLGATGNSVMAFISGCAKVTSYDIEWHHKAIEEALLYAEHLGHEWAFVQDNSQTNVIQQTDFLFIDGEHSYEAVRKELDRHHSKVNKFIGFHDVVSYATRNENPAQTGSGFIEGIVPAIFEFLWTHPEWKVDYYSPFNNGLLILSKTN